MPCTPVVTARLPLSTGKGRAACSASSRQLPLLPKLRCPVLQAAPRTTCQMDCGLQGCPGPPWNQSSRGMAHPPSSQASPSPCPSVVSPAESMPAAGCWPLAPRASQAHSAPRSARHRAYVVFSSWQCQPADCHVSASSAALRTQAPQGLLRAALLCISTECRAAKCSRLLQVHQQTPSSECPWTALRHAACSPAGRGLPTLSLHAGGQPGSAGGTPMGTPPSAKGIAANLPFTSGEQGSWTKSSTCPKSPPVRLQQNPAASTGGTSPMLCQACSSASSSRCAVHVPMIG